MRNTCLSSWPALAIKLTLVRRFHDAAIRVGQRQDNPAVGVSAPRAKRAAEDFDFLSEGELALLSLQVLRTAEITRARPTTCSRVSSSALLLRGKGHDRVIYRRQDVAEAVHAYLEARAAPPAPMRTACRS
jgi:hypothetical protein